MDTFFDSNSCSSHACEANIIAKTVHIYCIYRGEEMDYGETNLSRKFIFAACVYSSLARTSHLSAHPPSRNWSKLLPPLSLKSFGNQINIAFLSAPSEQNSRGEPAGTMNVVGKTKLHPAKPQVPAVRTVELNLMLVAGEVTSSGLTQTRSPTRQIRIRGPCRTHGSWAPRRLRELRVRLKQTWTLRLQACQSIVSFDFAI